METETLVLGFRPSCFTVEAASGLYSDSRGAGRRPYVRHLLVVCHRPRRSSSLVLSSTK
jgi:hypothetical protein